jgi:hypothetical protein
MWIDSDVGFSPDDVDRLREHDLPICGGIYPQKGRKALATHVLPGTEKVVFGAKGGLIEVLYSAAGFLYVKREVYETIQQQLNLPVRNAHFGRPLVPYFQPLVVEARGQESEIRGQRESPQSAIRNPQSAISPWYLAEDFSFCHRARQCGYKIMADTRIRLRHFGTYAYMWEDAGSDLPRYGTYHFGVEEGG